MAYVYVQQDKKRSDDHQIHSTINDHDAELRSLRFYRSGDLWHATVWHAVTLWNSATIDCL